MGPIAFFGIFMGPIALFQSFFSFIYCTFSKKFLVLAK